jgi:hypothetical protein
VNDKRRTSGLAEGATRQSRFSEHHQALRLWVQAAFILASFPGLNACSAWNRIALASRDPFRALLLARRYTAANPALPDGQITSLYRKYVNPVPQKYPASVFRKTMIISAHPAAARGAYRDRHGRGRRGCDGRIGARDETR